MDSVKVALLVDSQKIAYIVIGRKNVQYEDIIDSLMCDDWRTFLKIYN